MPTEQTLHVTALLAPPEHNRRTAKHIGTSWMCHWNIRSAPSLPVNCCVESGPCTTSLSVCFRSAAYRHVHSRGTFGQAVGLECQAWRSRLVRPPLTASGSWITAWLLGWHLGSLCSWLVWGCATACTPCWAGCSLPLPLLGWLSSLSLLFRRRVLLRSPLYQLFSFKCQLDARNLLWKSVCTSMYCILSCPSILFST